MYNKKRESQIIQIFQTFVLMIFLSHILASYLIVLGDGEGTPGEPLPWIKNNQGNFETLPEGQEINTEEHIAKLYIFSFYWIWTVITTVGYGDRSITMDYGDVLFTLLVEFIGLIMQAILINVMANFVEGNNTFSALVNSKLEPLQLWIQKIQVSNRPYYLDPLLYKKIVQNVEDAFFDDFNMIIEEFQFY